MGMVGAFAPVFALPLSAALIAPFVGSFIGTLIRRLPDARPVIAARSECEACGRRLGWWEMAPLLGYAGLRGRCAGCGARIAPMHPAVELAALTVAVWTWGADPDRVWSDCVLGWALLAASWIDWEHFWLPDAITLPLVLAGLVAGWAEGGWAWPDAAPLLADRALGAALGWSLLAGIAWGFERLRGYPGLGAGDAKLLAAGGAWLGWEALAYVLMAAAVAGIVVGLLRGAGRREPIPFGPCLAAAIWLMRVHGGALGWGAA